MFSQKEIDLILKNSKRDKPRSPEKFLELINLNRDQNLTIIDFQNFIENIPELNSDENAIIKMKDTLNSQVIKESEQKERTQNNVELAELIQKTLDRRVVDYQVVSEKTEAGVQQEVKKLISWGWEPVGGISAAAFGASPIGGNRFCQSLVKYEK